MVRFNHVGLTVRDLDTSLAFWSGQLGLRVLGRGLVEWEHLDRIVGLDGTQIEWAEIELPGDCGLLELFAYLQPPAPALPPGGMNRPGMPHICLEVDDIEEVAERLRAHGYPSRSKEVVTIPKGAYTGYKCVYVQDPDGITLELTERPPARAGAEPGDLGTGRVPHPDHHDQEVGDHG